MYSWHDGAVTIEDSVASSMHLSGDLLRTTFMPSISTVTLGVIRLRDRALYVGPVAIHRFGVPKIAANSVTWPITGGLLTASSGGHLTIESTGSELKARVEGYRPMLPRRLYEATQLRLHHGLVRVQLLRLAGRVPPAPLATPSARFGAAAIDLAVCSGMALVLARKRRLQAFTRIAIAYHLVAWSTSGQTIGGRVMRQRVVASDGSRVSLVQAALRLAALPLAAVRRYPAHDDIAATTVVQSSHD